MMMTSAFTDVRIEFTYKMDVAQPCPIFSQIHSYWIHVQQNDSRRRLTSSKLMCIGSCTNGLLHPNTHASSAQTSNLAPSLTNSSIHQSTSPAPARQSQLQMPSVHRGDGPKIKLRQPMFHNRPRHSKDINETHTINSNVHCHSSIENTSFYHCGLWVTSGARRFSNVLIETLRASCGVAWVLKSEPIQHFD